MKKKTKIVLENGWPSICHTLYCVQFIHQFFFRIIQHSESSTNSDDGFKVPTSIPVKSQKSAPPPGYKEQKSKAPPPGYTPPSINRTASETSISSADSEFKKPLAPPPGYKRDAVTRNEGSSDEPPAKKIKTGMHACLVSHLLSC